MLNTGSLVSLRIAITIKSTSIASTNNSWSSVAQQLNSALAVSREPPIAILSVYQNILGFEKI
jgi:hypothetical protein